MVGRMVLLWSLITVALLGVRTVAAAPITFTGNVASDFNQQTNPGVVVISDALHQNPTELAAAVGQPSYMTQSGLISGMDINDIRLYYNATNDTMYVGVNTYGVAGNVDGNGTPGTVDPRFAALGGSDSANWAGTKAMAIGFAPLSGTYDSAHPPTPVIVAGIPGTVNQLGTGLDGFNVSKYAPPGGSGSSSISLIDSFGATLTSGLGSLAFQPDAQHPGFEFSITNVSKLLGANPANGLGISVQDGSVSPLTGKDGLLGAYPEAQVLPETPEPATWMVWAVLAGGLAWSGYRRSRRIRPAHSLA
jgi:hypothetical protein